MKQEIHLLSLDHFGSPADGDTKGGNGTLEGAPRHVVVPDSVSFLHLDSDGEPRISDNASDSDKAVCLLEPVREGRKTPAVLMGALRKPAPLRNGFPAGVLSLLEVKDEVLVPGSSTTLCLTLYSRPAIGRPPPELVGTKCPVCRTRLKEATRVYICPNCGGPVHDELPEEMADGEEPLECLKLIRECPVCTAEICLTEGYSYLPSGIGFGTQC